MLKLGYMKRVAGVMLLGAGLAQAGAQGKTLRVAAAADLQYAMPAFAAAYEKETGVKLVVSFGSSSALATQIVNGAPVDVFLGADFTFPEKVIAAGLATEKLPVPYAKGALVLWVRKDSLLGPPTMDKLTDPRVTKIAVADQYHAPYGRAAYAAMRWIKVFDKVKDKLVTAENVGQAAQFLESGNAQIGFISLTQASSEHMLQVGTYIRVPVATYPEIKQCAVVLKGGNAAEGERFLEWMRSPKVQENLNKFGLEEVR